MPDSRRDFLRSASAAALLAIAAPAETQVSPPLAQTAPAGMPPAFGTAPATGPNVTPDDFTHAETLVQVTLTPAHRAEAAGNWRNSMAPLYERRTGPRKLDLPPSVSPYSIADPVRVAGGTGHAAQASQFVRTAEVAPLPADDASIAYATVHHLSRWIESRQLTSERLTRIYLARLQRFNPTLNCIITLTADHALEQARKADAEIAAGHYRGPLHGIPWGAKDLLDTAGIPTTYGAEPFRDRVPVADATVTQRLNEAGAVLVAKLSLGALALNDIWFGGQTVNPWLPQEGASGSSAGPGAATAAGLVGFSIGSETGGSIVSPSMRCGVTGLRPTFGRVPRTGAMTLCWSLDKLGPMTRSVEDAMLVLNAISGPDGADVSCTPSHLDVDLGRSPKGLKLGYFPKWMDEPPATTVDRQALDVARSLGMELIPLELPEWPYSSLQLILFAEGAAAFEELTSSGRDDELKMQVPDAWPNSFRQARFLSAVDFVQADRLRRRVALMMAQIFAGEALTGLPSMPNADLGLLARPSRTHPEANRSSGAPAPDLLLVPSLRDEMLTLSNFTGHPSLTFRAGFVEVSQARSDWAPDPAHPLPTFQPPRRVPHGITLIGRLFDEGTLATAGVAFERAFHVAADRPPNF